ncbi:Spherulation-specific family 4-domain-containing protein [Mycena olivaceomarginata]|nr:Spherulation-specific family 4-domain-containing protein [Mycena olivaceomarginata]
MILAILLAVLAFLTVVPAHAKTGIIVPLYSYPETTETWEPLETVISTFPNVQFYVIVNPASGSSPTDTNYQAAIAALRTHVSVLLVGYVLTSFGARPLDGVQQDIETYAGWPTASGLAGIFFDETQAGLTSTYTAYTDVARNTTWLGFLNPGEDIGASDYYTLADQIVAFENTYAQYQNQAPLPLPHPAQQAFIIHSFTSTNQTLASVIIDVNIATSDVYKSFGSDWMVFVQNVNA